MKKLVISIGLSAVALACSADRPSGPSNPVDPQSPTSPTPIQLEGRLAFVSTRDGAPHIYLAKPDGSDIRRLTSRTQSEFAPAWSPDGARLAFNSDDGNTYVINRDGSSLIRIPNGGGWPSWSPDGRRLMVGTEDGFRIVAADGTSDNEAVIHINATDLFGTFADRVTTPLEGKWSPDGSSIAFEAWVSGPDFVRAFVVDSAGRNGRTFLRGPGNLVWNECGPEWSPDGSRIALLSMIHGIAIVDLATGLATPIVNSGATCWDGDYSRVAWSPDGRALAVTKRDPPWSLAQPAPLQTSSIVIVDVQTRAVRSSIPDAYDPAWTRDE